VSGGLVTKSWPRISAVAATAATSVPVSLTTRISFSPLVNAAREAPAGHETASSVIADLWPGFSQFLKAEVVH
jgi:hypothetical protein